MENDNTDEGDIKWFFYPTNKKNKKMEIQEN